MRTAMMVSIYAISAASAAFSLTGCQATPKTQAEREEMMDSVQNTIAMFKERDPTIQQVLDDSFGYAVFPSIGKGAVGVGGAYGRGAVYREGEFIGWADVTQGSIGLQLGGQAFREIICFENQHVFQNFLDDKFAFSANASAVAADKGAAAQTDFDDGAIVFTMTRGGLMYEASVGGQNFDFEPADDSQLTRR